MGIRKFTLGELCTIEKGTTGISKAIPGKYPLVVTGEERKSHNSYQFDSDAVIIPLVSGTGHGHASIKRIHYQTGKFALGSILCALIPNDKLQLNAEYLYYYLDLNCENELVARMRGMANVTLPMKEIAKIEIPLPSIDEQRAFVNKYKFLCKKSNHLSVELCHQLDLIKNLRQQLLQDAVQGKLVAQNINDEPASDLLQKIKAEKDQLIKDKKLKKEKELPPIKPEEIPFEIPENWTWCRLADIANVVRGGSPRPAGDPQYYGGDIPFLKVGDLTGYEGVYCDKFIHSIKKAGLSKTRFVEANTLMLTNSGATLGVPRICTFSTTFNDGIAAFLDLKYVNKVYLFYFLKSRSEWFLNQASRGQGQPNLNTDIISATLFPFPPIKEQQRIIHKIEEIFQACDVLEASIKQSQKQNEQLLQQVLREALTKEIKQEEQLIEPVDVELKSDDKHNALLLAAEIIWRLNKRQTLGHIKLQKLIYLCNRTQMMNLPVNFLKWAMGPYDPELQKYIDTRLVENEWFKYDEDSTLKYQPLKRAGGHKEDFDKYFTNDKAAIDHLIQLFENAKSARIEIVATLFACWEEMITNNQLVNDNALLAAFYNWSEKKKKHSPEKVIDALRWMETQGIVPN